MSSQTVKTLFSHPPYIVVNNQGELSNSFSLLHNFHRLGRDSQQVDFVVPDNWDMVSRWQATFRKINNQYYIYDGDGTNPSSNRLFINHTLITPQEGYLLKNEDEIRIGQNPNILVTITYYESDPALAKLPQAQKISLKERSVVIGRDLSCTLVLESPTVSRKHATIDTDAQGRYILKDYSTNGVFVNDQKVNGSAVLASGDSIRIGPYILNLQGDQLIIANQGKNIRLDLDNLVRNDQGKLNHISLPIEPGQVVAIVGGSGAGKSTLMRAMLGITPTDSGIVYLNGENLRHKFNIYRTQIGYVPQSDIIHKDLTVAEVLTYAAELRLSDGINVQEIVKQTIAQIEVNERSQTLVRELSGGQLKRVSIGVELLADPKLFFLDEPTSGLDPGLDKKMMQLLRGLADQGRTVILVTHATANITLCDRIIFLGKDGNLCYFGPPQGAIDFFNTGSDNFADIYISLEQLSAVETKASEFKQSPDYQKYIQNRLIPGEKPLNRETPERVKGSFVKQVLILSRRYLSLIYRDRLSLGLNLLTAPVGILLMKLALPKDQSLLLTPDDPAPDLAPLALRVLFVFTCAAIWIGLFSSLQEIVKETGIYLRERLVNLEIWAYLSSKYLVLGGLAVVQGLLITLMILLSFQSPSSGLLPWVLGLLITTTLTIITAQSLGLMISAMVKNSNQANSSLPLLLIPQIIFSGVLFKMTGIGKFISWLMLSRWSVGAYGILVDVNGMIPEQPESVTPFDMTAVCKLPFESSPVYSDNWSNLLVNWGILLLHSLIYISVTFFLQKAKDVYDA